MKPMYIETERMTITQFDETMIEQVHLNSLDEANRRFVPDEVFETVEKAREVVEWLMSAYEGDEGPFVYPMILNSGENIGYVQAVPFRDGFEIGYHVAGDFAGKGYATEAVSAFLPVIMDKLGIDRIWGDACAENGASRRVLEKCGFVLEYEGMGEYQGTERPIALYSYREEAQH